MLSNKLAAPKLHDSVIRLKHLQHFLCRLPSLQRLGFFRLVFLGKSTTKSGRARIVEFSQNQTCRRPGRRPETRSIRCLVGSGPVRPGSERVRLVEFGHVTIWSFCF